VLQQVSFAEKFGGFFSLFSIAVALDHAMPDFLSTMTNPGAEQQRPAEIQADRLRALGSLRQRSHVRDEDYSESGDAWKLIEEFSCLLNRKDQK
jgi:hypothetical protein